MGERYAIFDPRTGKQIGRSTNDRREAMQRQARFAERGRDAAPTVVRHDQETKREGLR